MFDPEKVERLSQIDVESVTPVGDFYDPLYVRAPDYDALLALYRELQRSFVVGQNQEEFHL